MAKRITKETKAIADAHILARLNKSFNPIPCKTADDVKKALRQGYTFEEVMDEIEIRYCSVTSSILARMLQHDSGNYKAAVYKAFKQLLD